MDKKYLNSDPLVHGLYIKVKKKKMGIKPMSHAVKLWKNEVERILRKETQVSNNKFEFMLRRYTMEANHLL